MTSKNQVSNSSQRSSGGIIEPASNQSNPFTMEDIICNNNPEGTVALAKKIARDLKRKESTNQDKEKKEASSTQVRRLFASLRQIQMGWRIDPQKGYRELILFGPRLAYQSFRHPAISPLTELIQDGIALVKDDSVRLQRLVDFFEAVVAYYISSREV